jgi:WD40 repeat protein
VSSEGKLIVWDFLVSGSVSQAGAFQAHDGAVSAVAVSGDGRVAVSTWWDGTVMAFDLISGHCIGTFTCDSNALCCAVGLGVVVAGDAAGRVHFLALEWDPSGSCEGAGWTASDGVETTNASDAAEITDDDIPF